MERRHLRHCGPGFADTAADEDAVKTLRDTVSYRQTIQGHYALWPTPRLYSHHPHRTCSRRQNCAWRSGIETCFAIAASLSHRVIIDLTRNRRVCVSGS